MQTGVLADGTRCLTERKTTRDDDRLSKEVDSSAGFYNGGCFTTP